MIQKVEITFEKTICVSKEFEVTEEQLMELKNGENPFHDELENELPKGDITWDYTVNDEDGNTLVDWS